MFLSFLRLEIVFIEIPTQTIARYRSRFVKDHELDVGENLSEKDKESQLRHFKTWLTRDS